MAGVRLITPGTDAGPEAFELQRVFVLSVVGVLLASTLALGQVGDLTGGPGDLIVQPAAAGGQDDGGTGMDASDQRSAPTRLAASGSYTGTLGDESDVDWFGLAPETASGCVEASASGSAQTGVTLEFPGLSRTTTDAYKPQDRTVDLALTGAGISDVLFGFHEVGDRPRAPGGYSFDLTTYAASELLGQPDAGTGSDAGSSIATAGSAVVGCSGGSLTGGDTGDVYAFDGASGLQVTTAMAQVAGSTDLVLELLDPTGQSVMSLSSSEAGTYTLDEDGTWYLSVHRSEGTTMSSPSLSLAASSGATEDEEYLLSLGGPEPEPCDPGCFD